MFCPLLAMVLEVLLDLSRASRRASLGRLVWMPQAWRTALTSLTCNHCEHKPPVPTDIFYSALEGWSTFIEDSMFLFDPVDRVHIRLIVSGGDLYPFDTHTCITVVLVIT